MNLWRDQEHCRDQELDDQCMCHSVLGCWNMDQARREQWCKVLAGPHKVRWELQVAIDMQNNRRKRIWREQLVLLGQEQQVS